MAHTERERGIKRPGARPSLFLAGLSEISKAGIRPSYLPRSALISEPLIGRLAGTARSRAFSSNCNHRSNLNPDIYSVYTVYLAGVYVCVYTSYGDAVGSQVPLS